MASNYNANSTGTQVGGNGTTPYNNASSQSGSSGYGSGNDGWQSSANVSQLERTIYLISGAALVGFSLLKRRNALLALPIGAYLLFKGAVGNSQLYSLLGMNTAVRTNPETVSVPHQQGAHISEAITIDRPAAAVYAFWKNPDNLPKIVPHLDRVETSGSHGHWTFQLPARLPVTLDVDIINDLPNEAIAWRSASNSFISHAGAVRFTPDGNSTEVRVEVEYVPPAGAVGVAAAKIAGAEPSSLIQEMLRNLKQQIETGETATS